MTSYVPIRFSLFTINYESMHKAPNLKWDLIICDEAHSLGAFPKPNKRSKAVRDLILKTKSEGYTSIRYTNS